MTNVFTRFKEKVINKIYNDNRIKQAIKNIKIYDVEYWTKTLEQRLSTGQGSITIFTDTVDLENALLNAKWDSYSHDSISSDCTAFVTKDIKSYLGIVEVSSLSDNAIFKLDDFKNTGKVSCVVQNTDRPECDFTVLILGKEVVDNPDSTGKVTIEIPFTFHAGEPVRPSIVETSNVDLNKEYTKSEILELGFKYAKIAY